MRHDVIDKFVLRDNGREYILAQRADTVRLHVLPDGIGAQIRRVHVETGLRHDAGRNRLVRYTRQEKMKRISILVMEMIWQNLTGRHFQNLMDSMQSQILALDFVANHDGSLSDDFHIVDRIGVIGE